jgi:hypothetical protein
MKYDRNTAHTKRVKYDENQPFTTGLISPGINKKVNRRKAKKKHFKSENNANADR